MDSVSHPKRILILDDDPDIRGGISSYLQTLKFEAISTSQWTEALDLVAHRPPDLILLDLHMPTIQGDAVLNFIRRQGHALPVIVMSAHMTDEIVGELRLMGVKDFLQKPFHLRDLGALVHRTLGLADETEPPLRSDNPPAPGAEAFAPSFPSPVPVPAQRPSSDQRADGSQEPQAAAESSGRRSRKRRRSRKIPNFRIYITIAWVCFLGALIIILVTYLWSRFAYFPL